ncbi:hypothetical protein NKH18_27845 [Streptomyces sp. M10(2022)]
MHCTSSWATAWESWDGEEAELAVRAAVACERAAGHVRGEASAVELLGLLSLHQWLYDAAYARFVEAEQLYRQIAPGQEGAGTFRGPSRWPGVTRGGPCAAWGGWRSHGCCWRPRRTSSSSGQRVQPGPCPDGSRRDAARRGRDGRGPDEDRRGRAAARPAAAPHLGYLAGLRLRCEAGR